MAGILRDTAERVRRAWARSLGLRTVTTTLVLSLLVVAIVAVALLNRVSAGLLEAKEDRSLAEAARDWQQAEQLLRAAGAGPASAPADVIVDGVVGELARNAGSPPSYEVLLLQAPDATVPGPQRATNLISPSSVPPRLVAALEATGGQQWTYTTAEYLDGTGEPGLVVGAPLTIPGVGPYQLFHVFPSEEEQRIINLVGRATLVAGALLVGLLVLVVLLVTRQVAVPVRQASRVAVQVSSGDLDQRVPVRGEDEMAQLAMSFNTMTDNLQRQITELEDLSRVQQRFASDVSHELRTPLTTIRMAADVLHDRRPVVDPDTQRAIELLADQVDRFEVLLADLLEISRLDAGAAELDLEQTDLAELVARVIEDAQPLAAERGSDLRWAGPSSALVVIDGKRVSRVLRNLLSNALEYGAGEPIDVMLAIEGGAVALGVRDHGPGMSPADLGHVFDRFWRADPSRARTLGGTGLGLAIAREDAQLHRGQLEAVALPGAGALFVLTLPTDPAGESASRPVPIDLRAFDKRFAAAAGGSR